MSKTPTDLSVIRLRHPLKARRLQVRNIVTVTPKMLSVTFYSADLADFVSASFDDHIKLFFPADGQPIMPEASADGLRFPDGVERPVARDYTPRRYRQNENELDIDFLLHGDGPASNWVSQAQAGDVLIAAGPRGSFIIPDTYDWQMMIGDETALPAITRRLEEAPEGKHIYVIALVHDASERQIVKTHANVHIQWVYRHASDAVKLHTDPLLTAVTEIKWPSGQGYIWGAGESAQMRELQRHLSEDRGVDTSRMRISNYWKQHA
ncbi:siderophore-interacting protein [Alcaligenaceae bacterium]|nr:siderophore-interacting protein [Alcaligenaceae bacterium]